MLYEQHPSLVHSTVCVIIVVTPFAREDCKPAAVSTSEGWMDGQDGSLSWHDVEGINRLCVRVNFVSPVLAVPGLLQAWYHQSKSVMTTTSAKFVTSAADWVLVSDNTVAGLLTVR